MRKMYTSKFKVVRKAPLSKIDENKICCLDVEQVVLGQLIAVGDIFSKISVDLKISDFYSRKNQLVYKAILALADGGRPIDVRTVVEQLGVLCKSPSTIKFTSDFALHEQ